MLEGSDIEYLGPILIYFAVAALFSFFVMIREGLDKEWGQSEGRKTWIFLTVHTAPVMVLVFSASVLSLIMESPYLLDVAEVVALTYPLSLGMYELSNHTQRSNEQKINRLESEIRDLKRRMT